MNMVNDLSPIQRSLLVIEGLKSKLKTLEDSGTEPVAIVGMSCRFSGGAVNTAAYWHLLSGGLDGIEEIPAQRWDVDAFFDPDPEASGKTYCRYGGFLQNVESFDAHFFGISPREAVSIDPQHRLLLEVSWEALEHAGYDMKKIKGSNTGVFLGITLSDYEKVIRGNQVDHHIEPYGVTGLPLNAAAGRISYTYGFTGPSLAIDTACSSSLVAIHQACQSLRLKECNMALAGGVNLILSPDSMVSTAKAKMLSPDGYCKTFDERADGIGRAEGCGVIVLKRLSDAVADGDHILAVVKGSAVNQDGPSSGFTVPSSSAQQELIRAALKMAKTDPSEISYVEAHGTGTPLGDPIELRSLAEVFGKGETRNQPLKIGSVKTNIGHAESASGIAGVIKVILQLQHQKIAPHLHFNKPTSKFNWDSFAIKVPTELSDWEVNGSQRIAGVSSFGASGTNGHVIIAEAPVMTAKEDIKHENAGFQLLTLSAKNPEALAELVTLYHDHLEAHPDIRIEDFCNSANAFKTHFNNRIVIAGVDKQDVITKLAAYKRNEQVKGIISNATDKKNVNAPKIAFLFSGQGTQYVQMGKTLYQRYPVFRQALDYCTELLKPYLDYDLTALLFPVTDEETAAALLNSTQYAQPAIVAIEYALVKLWESLGVKPDVVMGHSVGEYTAAVAAGVMRIEDCLKLIAMRGRLMQALPVNGGMVSVNIPASDMRSYIAPFKETVAIAAINGSSSTVISGSLQSLELIVERLKSAGFTTTDLNVTHAFHSPLMTPMLAAFEDFAKTLTYNRANITIISNVTGERKDEAYNAAYWVDHVMQPVNFELGVQTMAKLGYRLFLEVGPKPVLTGLGRNILNSDHQFIPSLRANVNELEHLLTGLAGLYVQGVECNLAEVYAAIHTRRLVLPAYPFQREYYWAGKKAGLIKPEYSFDNQKKTTYIGQRVSKQGSRAIYFQSAWNSSYPAYVKDHIIFEKILVAGASHVAMLLSAFKEVSNDEVYHLEDMYLTEALVFDSQSKRLVEVVLDGHTSNSASFNINSYDISKNDNREDGKRNHVSGKMCFGKTLKNIPDAQQIIALDEIRSRCTAHLPGDEFYDGMWRADYHLGTSFRWIKDIWQTRGEAIGILETPELPDQLDEYVLHPGLVDSCLQMVGITAEPDKIRKMENADYIFAPFHIERFQVYQQPQAHEVLWCYCVINEAKSNELILASDIVLMSETGRKLVEIVGFETRKAPKEVLLKSLNTTPHHNFYEVAWIPQDVNPEVLSASKSKWLIYGNTEEWPAQLGAELTVHDQDCVFVSNADDYLEIDAQHYRINGADPAQVEQVLIAHSGIECVVLLLNDQPGSRLSSFTEIQEAQKMHFVVLYFLQAILKRTQKAPVSVFIITQGTQHVVDTRDVLQPQFAGLWGIGKVFTAEHPEIPLRLIDLDATANEGLLIERLAEELLIRDEEKQVAIRNGIRYTARLVKGKFKDSEPVNRYPVQSEASYLIAGGLGDLGLEFAGWLAAQGAKHIILTSRSAASANALNVIDVIEKAGTTVTVVQCDISEQAQLSALLAEIEASAPALKGIINAAGVLDDRPIAEMTEAHFLKVMRPKIEGSWNLHQQTRHLQLDFFICFSSMSSLIGTRHQANYAAANAFMDAFVAYRKGNGLSGLSINWGPWAELGMAARMGNKYISYMEKGGVNLIEPAAGIQALALLLQTNKTNAGFLDIDWSKYEKEVAAGYYHPFLQNFISLSAADAIPYESYLEGLNGLSDEERLEFITTVISKEIARILATEVARIDLYEPLSAIGIDSLMAMEIRATVHKRLNVDIPIGKLLEGGNIIDLAETINSNIADWGTDTAVESGSTRLNNNVQQVETFIEGEL